MVNEYIDLIDFDYPYWHTTQDTLDKRFEGLKPYSPESIGEFADTMKKYVDHTHLRI